MLNPLSGITSKYQYYGTGKDDTLISGLGPDLENTPAFKPDFVIEPSFDENIPPKTKQKILNIINVCFQIITDFMPADMENPFNLRGKKITPLDGKVFLHIGNLKQSVKEIFNIDVDKIPAYSGVKLDSLFACAKRRSSNKALMTVFLDAPSLIKTNKFSAWLAALTRAICGDMPMYIKDKVPKNKYEKEYLAHSSSNKVLANIIKNMEGKISERIIKQLKEQFQKEKEFEEYYRKRIKK